jgi:large subunit ribosomal protein L23
MATTTTKTKTTKAKASPKKKEVALVVAGTASTPSFQGTGFMDPASVLLRPRVTEKASFVAEKNNVYTFDIDPRATKNDVAEAVKALYKVTPVKVAVVVSKRKHVVVRGKIGMKKGGKKAYVYLKTGDKIEII